MVLPQVVRDVGALVLGSAQAVALDILGVVGDGQVLVRVRVPYGRDEVALVQGLDLHQLVRSQLVDVNLVVLFFFFG